MNHCWNYFNLDIRDELKWNIKQNSYISIQEHANENVTCEMACEVLGIACRSVLLIACFMIHYHQETYTHVLKFEHREGLVYSALILGALSCLHTKYFTHLLWFIFMVLRKNAHCRGASDGRNTTNIGKITHNYTFIFGNVNETKRTRNIRLYLAVYMTIVSAIDYEASTLVLFLKWIPRIPFTSMV